jgi:hypothetical protein
MVTLWIRYESLLEEHNDELVIDLRDDVSLVAEMLDKLLEGLTLLLDDGNQVPVNSQTHTRGMEVVGEQSTQMALGPDRPQAKHEVPGPGG